MSILANAKAKVASGSVKEAFKNEDGAIDLASIMVGIIVIGLIGGVIAATVFAVIPWAQDNAAKQQLDSVANAENAYIGLTADGSVSITPAPAKNSYGDNTQLKDAKLLDLTGSKVVVTPTDPGTDGTGAHYTAVVTSDTGKKFQITDQATKAAPVAP